MHVERRPRRRLGSYRRARLGCKAADHESGRLPAAAGRTIMAHNSESPPPDLIPGAGFQNNRPRASRGYLTVLDAPTVPPPGVTSKAKRKAGRSSPGWSSAKVSWGMRKLFGRVSWPL